MFWIKIYLLNHELNNISRIDIQNVSVMTQHCWDIFFQWNCLFLKYIIIYHPRSFPYSVSMFMEIKSLGAYVVQGRLDKWWCHHGRLENLFHRPLDKVFQSSVMTSSLIQLSPDYIRTQRFDFHKHGYGIRKRSKLIDKAISFYKSHC